MDRNAAMTLRAFITNKITSLHMYYRTVLLRTTRQLLPFHNLLLIVLRSFISKTLLNFFPITLIEKETMILKLSANENNFQRTDEFQKFKNSDKISLL